MDFGLQARNLTLCEISTNIYLFTNVIFQVHNVDEVLERHNDFLESCLGDCMLTSPQLLKAVTALCLVCVQFCNFIQVRRSYVI